jgi:NTE family protein
VGSIALAARTAPEPEFRDVVASILEPIRDWPDGLVVTAVDALDGSLACLDRTSGVPLVTAVAASAALPVLFPTITIEGRPYIDGGMASDTNVRLVADADEILLLVPVDRGALETELGPLRERGTEVRVVKPGSAAREALGEDLEMLDPARRARSAQAGYEEGLALGRSWAGSDHRRG